MPTIGPAFEPLPDDAERTRRSRRPARRTAGPARPRRDPRLQPLLPARGAARPAGADPDRAWRGGSTCERGAADGRTRGGSWSAARPRRWSWSAPTWRPAAPPTTPEKTQDPCKPRPWRDPRGLAGDRRAVHALRSRRRRLPARRHPRDPGPGAGHPEARERFAEKYGIDDEKLAKAIRAGLLRAVDDAEEAGALSPFLGGAAAGDGRTHPPRTGDRTGQGRRSLFSGEGSSAPSATSSKNCCPELRARDPGWSRRASVRRVAPQTQTIIRGCRGRRAQSAQRGIFRRSSP